MKPFHTAIFDMDGTILDSMGVWAQIDERFLGARGIEPPADYMEAVAPMSYQEMADYTIGRFQLSERPEEIIDEWNAMAEEAYRSLLRLKDGAKEYLLFLKSRGVKIGLATASGPSLYLPALQNNGVYDLFDAVSCTAECKRGKGFPDIYLLTAQKLQAKAKGCVVFEDILAGIRGAKAAGMLACGVYDRFAEDQAGQIRREADEYIHSFRELLP